MATESLLKLALPIRQSDSHAKATFTLSDFYSYQPRYCTQQSKIFFEYVGAEIWNLVTDCSKKIDFIEKVFLTTGP